MENQIKMENAGNSKMNILTTNDEGIGSGGLFALYESLKDVEHVVIVAPGTLRIPPSPANHQLTGGILMFQQKRGEPDGRRKQ